MTKDEAITAYGDVPLKFADYYKYTFTFIGKAPDGAVVSIGVGGNSEGIYRYSVTPDTTETLKALGWYSASIVKDGEKLLDLYEY